MTKKIIYSLVCIILIFNSCVDEIDINVDGDQSRIVVDGRITDSLAIQTIRISTSAVIGVGNDNVLPPITGASVKVIDDQGLSFDFPETSDGVYQAEMAGVVGRTYSLDILLPGNKRILSKPGLLNAPPPSPTLRTEVFEVTNSSGTGGAEILTGVRLKADVDFSDSNYRPLLRWQASGEYEIREAYPMALTTKSCYVKTKLDLNLIKTFDTNTLADGILLDEQVLVTQYDYKFAIQYCFKVFNFAITEEEFIYWNQINDIVNIDGNFFDPPPGTVQGNLYNPDDENEEILGYFSTAGVGFSRLFTNPNTTGVFVEERCSFSPFQPQYPECRACEDIINSSVERPEYWEN